MTEMNTITKKTTERKCDSCGEVKPDVEFRTWDGIDAAEWDILCASCAKKKEREMKRFWILLTSFVVMGLVMLAAFAAALIFT